MKKLLRLAGLTAGIVLTIACAAAAEAAVVVDKTGPTYDGEYFIAYNANIGYTAVNKSMSGTLPSSIQATAYRAERNLISEEPDDPVSGDIINVRVDEDGRTLYQVEPRNLDQITPPKQTVRFYSQRANATLKLGDERSFVTVDMNTNAAVRVPFILKYSGDNCNIWLEKENARGVTDEMVSELGMEYDYYIHERMQKAFGPTLDLNGDGKMAILLYDIQDTFSINPNAGQYTGGFFNAGDLLTGDYNCMDVLHIDTYPSIPESGDLSEIKSTMVHELQHLIECSAIIDPASVGSGTIYLKCGELPVWVNEALSMAAEHMFYGVLEDRIKYYNGSRYRQYTPLANWDYGDSLSHYTLSYLFGQYLRVQTKDFPGGGEELFKRLINSDNRGDRCIETAMRSFYPAISFSDILLNFNIALTLNEDSGPYGFGGDKDFDAVTDRFKAEASSRASSLSGTYLGSGAAVVTHPGRGSYKTPTGASSDISFAAFRLADEGEALPVEAPRSDTASGEVYKFKYIKLHSSEPYSNIYYTVDGTVPTPENGIVYTGKPIQLLSTTELKAITVTVDGRESPVASYKYTIAKDDFEFYRRTVGNNAHYDGVEATGVIVSPDGGYIQVGSIKNGDIGGEDFYEVDMRSVSVSQYNSSYLDYRYSGYITKYTATGKQEWIKLLRSGSDVNIHGITAADDGFVVTGEAYWGDKADREDSNALDFVNALTPKDESPEELENALSHSAYVAKYDWEGNLKWVSALPFIRENPDSYHSDKAFHSVVSLRDDSGAVYGYVAAGQMYDPEASRDSTEATIGLIARFDLDGNLVWQKFLKGRLNFKGGNFQTVVMSHDGKSVVAAGEYGPGNFGQEDSRDLISIDFHPNIKGFCPIAACYDVEDGSLRWTNAYDFDFQYYMSNGWITDLLPLEDGSTIAVGFDNRTDYNNKSQYYMHTLRIDTEGNKVWRTPERIATGFTPAVALAEDGIMVVHSVGALYEGKTWLTAHKLKPISKKDMDILAVKYDLDGNFIWAKNYLSPYHEGVYGNRGFHINNVVRLSDRKFLVCAYRDTYTYCEDTLRDHGVLFTFYDESANHYNVTGTIATAEGAPLVGVTVKYTLSDDPAEYAVLTDSQGQYSIKVVEEGSVTLTPELEGYTFTSVNTGSDSETVGPVTAASPGHDFTAEIVKLTVSGKVIGLDGQGLSGIQVGSEPEDVTGTDGTYSIQVRPGVTLSLAPVSEEPDVEFEPVLRVLPAINEDIAEQNFRVVPPQYTISGKVTHEDGTGQGGVRVGDTLTAPDGTYSITVDMGSSLTLAPMFPQYAFEPSNRDYTAVKENFSEQDFIMKPKTEEPDKPEPEKPQPEKPTPPSGGGGSEREEKEPTPAKPVQPESKPSGTHISYLQGYPDGGFHPDDPMTRAQCATMLARLLEDYDPEGTYAPLPFSDTAADRWFAGYLSFVHQKGVVKGYPDGSFRPDEPMTRAEFATVVRNILKPENAEAAPFSDTTRHWARNAIGQLAAMDILNGYPDGTFRPDDPISRAEAAKVLNQAYRRAMEKGDRPTGEAPDYSDLAESHWAYYDIWEASVEHSISSFHGND